MKILSRTVRVLSLLLFGSIALLGLEVLLARRGVHLDPFPPGSLDGIVGDGADPLRITWMGDSTGDGVGASTPEDTLPRRFARALRRPVTLTVLARSGARVADAIDEQLPQLAATEPAWVIVGIGSNDVTHLTSRGRFRGELDRLLDGVSRAHPERVVVIGPGQFASTPRFLQPLRFVAGRRARALDRVEASVARTHGALYVDIIERVGRFFVEDPSRYHAIDRFHPNDEGYGLWARALLDVIHAADRSDATGPEGFGPAAAKHPP